MISLIGGSGIALALFYGFWWTGVRDGHIAPEVKFGKYLWLTLRGKRPGK